jgi:Flp pilus assembly pilin Flp
MKKFFLRLWKEQLAQDTTEYALLLLLLALAAITSTKTLANGIKGAYSNVASNISSHTGGSGGGGGGGGNGNGGNGNGGNGNGGEGGGGRGGN